MPDGGAVTIATASAHVAPADARFSDTEPGDYVALSVTDTGAQIGSLAQQHLFEPFFPATAHEPATGLGLAIVYGAVKQSGGDVKVESPFGADGRGSRFTVLLPAARDASRGAAPEGDTVLLVGGNRDVQSFIGDVLRRRGYQLLQADDAREAVRVADAHASQIRLLITAGVSGVGAANAIRERHPAMRRLHVSASTDDGAEHENRRRRRARGPRAAVHAVGAGAQSSRRAGVNARRLPAAGVHLEVRILPQQILHRHERAAIAERQAVLGAAIVASAASRAAISARNSSARRAAPQRARADRCPRVA